MSEWDRKHWEKKLVTLPRVWGIEGGVGYVTVPFVQEEDGRGDHMRLLIKRRRKVYGANIVAGGLDAGLRDVSRLHPADHCGAAADAEPAAAV